MSEKKSNSLLSSAWRAALGLLGIVVAVWIAIQLLLQIWIVLVIVVALGLITAAIVACVRSRRRW